MNLSWHVESLNDLALRVLELTGGARPAIIGVDGHSSSGKTSFAGRIATALPDSDVLHTDDLAWHQGVFAWDVLLLREVLPVVRAGTPLHYRPPAWRARGRLGEITLAGGLQCLVIEGVGASQSSVRDELDIAIWVETDEPTRLARDSVRVAAGEIDFDGYLSWMAEENAHVTRHRPWEHADLLVYGGDSIGHDPETEVVVAQVPTSAG
jgi:uridine kinase